MAKVKIFLNNLDSTGKGFKEFDITAWHALVDYVEVMPENLKFHLKDGSEETIELL